MRFGGRRLRILEYTLFLTYKKVSVGHSISDEPGMGERGLDQMWRQKAKTRLNPGDIGRELGRNQDIFKYIHIHFTKFIRQRN